MKTPKNSPVLCGFNSGEPVVCCPRFGNDLLKISKIYSHKEIELKPERAELYLNINSEENKLFGQESHKISKNRYADFNEHFRSKRSLFKLFSPDTDDDRQKINSNALSSSDSYPTSDKSSNKDRFSFGDWSHERPNLKRPADLLSYSTRDTSSTKDPFSFGDWSDERPTLNRPADLGSSHSNSNEGDFRSDCELDKQIPTSSLPRVPDVEVPTKLKRISQISKYELHFLE